MMHGFTRAAACLAAGLLLALLASFRPNYAAEPNTLIGSWKLISWQVIAEDGTVIVGVPGPFVQVSVTVIEVPMTVVPVNWGLVSLVTGTPPTRFTFGSARVGLSTG